MISRIDVLKLGGGLQVWGRGEMVCLGWQVEANQLLGESDGQVDGNKKKQEFMDVLAACGTGGCAVRGSKESCVYGPFSDRSPSMHLVGSPRI